MTIRKNDIADAAGLGQLSESDLHAFAGIAGDPNDARTAEVELFGGVTATLVLCDDALGVYWHDERDDYHGFAMYGVARLVRELVAVELVKWDERHPDVELNDDVLGRLGFESVF